MHLEFSLCLAAEINRIHHPRGMRVSLPSVVQDRLLRLQSQVSSAYSTLQTSLSSTAKCSFTAKKCADPPCSQQGQGLPMASGNSVVSCGQEGFQARQNGPCHANFVVSCMDGDCAEYK